ncbi:MAG TPA: MBL fold metallo-hydrolase [Gemmatimonadaceae bacterium]|nr:MBL fold metallo-hydrolase [Gemmatimonadaceae bacterium]
MSAPEPLLQTRRIGSWTVHAIQAGGQMLDGGAMFGVVPKVLWERRIPADARNRIPMGMRCLLIEHDTGLILIDTGAGNKETDKFYDIYGIENAGGEDRTALEAGIRAAGHRPEDVSLVINSHLHFDHGGGNTYRGEDGSVRLSLPNARYVVQRGEYEFATHTNERTAASYFPHNFVPIHEAGRFDLVEGEREIVPGITVIPTPGHVPFHQGILIESGGERAFYLADLVPTAAHLPLPWIMGYDLEPLVTLETKRHILKRAREEDWLVIFEHDATNAWGRVSHDGKSYAFVPDGG